MSSTPDASTTATERFCDRGWVWPTIGFSMGWMTNRRRDDVLSTMPDVVRRFRPVIVETARMHERDASAIDDIVSQVLWVVYRKLDVFAGLQAKQQTAWIVTATRNLCAHHIRSAMRQQRLVNRVASISEDSDIESAEETVVDNADSDAVSAEVAAALDLLSDGERRVLAMRTAGMTGEEIAEVLNISAGAVRARLHRATVAFKAAYVGQSDGIGVNSGDN